MSILVPHSNYLEMLLNYPWKEFLFFSPEYLMWFEQRDVPRRETRPQRKTENKSGDLIHDVSASVLHTVTECGSHFHSLLLHNDTTDNSAANNTTHYCWCFHPHTHTLCSSLLHLSLTHTYTQLADCHSELWRSGQPALCDWLLWVTDCLPSRCGVTPWIVRPLSRTHFHLVTVCILLNLIFHLSYFWLQVKTLTMVHADKMNLYALKAERWIISILHKPPQNKQPKKKMWVCFWVSYFLVV